MKATPEFILDQAAVNAITYLLRAAGSSPYKTFGISGKSYTILSSSGSLINAENGSEKLVVSTSKLYFIFAFYTPQTDKARQAVVEATKKLKAGGY